MIQDPQEGSVLNDKVLLNFCSSMLRDDAAWQKRDLILEADKQDPTILIGTYITPNLLTTNQILSNLWLASDNDHERVIHNGQSP